MQSSKMGELLIEYVRKYPVLYDPTLKDYRNQLVKNEAWEDIGMKLAISGNECKEMWFKLRNAYTNALRRRQTKSGQFGTNYIKWKYEDEMAFLPSTADLKRAYGGFEMMNMTTAVNEGDQDSKAGIFLSVDPTSEYSMWHTDDSGRTSDETSQSPACPTPSRFHRPSSPKDLHSSKRRRLDTSVSEMVALMRENNRLQEQLLNCASHPLTPCDETEMFFLSLAKTVKKLGPEEQTKIKMEVSNAVFQAKLRQVLRDR